MTIFRNCFGINEYDTFLQQQKNKKLFWQKSLKKKKKFRTPKAVSRVVFEKNFKLVNFILKLACQAIIFPSLLSPRLIVFKFIPNNKIDHFLPHFNKIF